MIKSPAGVIRSVYRVCQQLGPPFLLARVCMHVCVCVLECTDGQPDLAVCRNMKVLGVGWSVKEHCVGHCGPCG